LDYKQKSLLAEFSYLFFIAVLSPFAVGLQIFSEFSFVLSLVLVNILDLPVIVLFYRLYLPFTVGKGKYWLAIILLPVYLLLYELNSRLGSLIVIALPFIPEQYRRNLSGSHPEDLTQGYFNQSLGYTGLVLLAATSLYVIKLLFRKQHHLYIMENEKLKLELSHLKSQIQPHFFFNTLNNLYSLSVHHSPKTPKMIKDLSTIMRYVLYETEKDKVPLKQEVNFINSYIDLENLRHTGSVLIDFSVQGDIESIKIEPLLFLPLIENTFKHALHTNNNEKWVKLVLVIDDDELIFQTTNPKETFHESKKGEGSGIGLANVKKRLQLLYPAKHELMIHEDGTHYTVTLTLNR
jgi:sensor histidine kinase YesM